MLNLDSHMHLTNAHFELLHSGTVKLSSDLYFVPPKYQNGWSQCLRGLRCGSAATGLLEFHGQHGCVSLIWVVCCQVEVSAVGWWLIQRSPTLCGVCKVEIAQGYFPCYSPANEQATSKLAMPMTCRNEKAEQWANSAVVHRLTSQRWTEEF